MILPPARPALTGARRRNMRQREARAVQRESVGRVAQLIGEGRFAEARASFGDVICGQAGDPRARIQPAADAPPLVQPVFVCGLHRSGTTLLVDHLKTRFDLAWFQRSRVPEEEGQFLQDVYPQEMPFGGPGAFAFAPQMRLHPVNDPEAARAQAARLSACWGRATGGARLLEKSPSNIVRIAYLRSLFPDARFIVWTRDPRAVSLATRKWQRRSTLAALMQHWNTAYLAALDDLDDDCIIARYEDFCAEPEAELERISRFCSLDARSNPLQTQDRFEEIRNSNGKYIDAFPPEALTISGIAAWELFGYHLPQPSRRLGGAAVTGSDGGATAQADTVGEPVKRRRRRNREPVEAGAEKSLSGDS